MSKEDVLKEFVAIPGVGMSKAKALYSEGFTSMELLKDASVEEQSRCLCSPAVLLVCKKACR